MITNFNNVTIKEERWLVRYLHFIEKFKCDKAIKGETHNHHILPASLFPEYKNLSLNSFNKAILTTRAHLIAHYMLAKALGGNMWFAYNNMNAHNVKLSSRLYESARLLVNTEISNMSIGFVMAKDITTGQILKVDSFTFYNSENLIGVTKNLFSGDKNVSKRQDVKDKISEKKKGFINVIDLRTNKKTSIHFSNFDETIYIKATVSELFKNGICVKDKNGNFLSVKRDDERYLSGELVHINKGRIQSQENKEKKSKSLKGKPKKNTENYNKIYFLIKDTLIFKLIGAKELNIFADEQNISVTRLKSFKNLPVPVMTTNQVRNYKKCCNTTGWMLLY